MLYVINVGPLEFSSEPYVINVKSNIYDVRLSRQSWFSGLDVPRSLFFIYSKGDGKHFDHHRYPSRGRRYRSLVCGAKLLDPCCFLLPITFVCPKLLDICRSRGVLILLALLFFVGDHTTAIKDEWDLFNYDKRKTTLQIFCVF